MSLLSITGPQSALCAHIQLPFSKSLINRSLIIKALAGDDLNTALDGFDASLIANDCRVMHRALTETGSLHNMEDAGTAMRFLLAFFASRPGQVQLTGTKRLLQRPLAPLIHALGQLGADIECMAQQGFAPLHIKSPATNGGRIVLDASVSSQFVSALLMIAPCLKGGLELELKGHVVSAAYTAMTITLMQQAGAKVLQNGNTIQVAEGRYTADLPLCIEPDWSAASYWLLITALLPLDSSVLLKGLSLQSVQGDREVAALCQPFGVQVQQQEEGLLVHTTEKKIDTFEYDFTSCPDLVPAMAVLCAAKGVNGKFTGVAHLGLKESDRVQALATELARVGAKLQVATDGVFYIGTNGLHPAAEPFHTHLDHRMAMSLAALSLVLPGISIQGTEVVAKSYPGFWQQLRQVGFEVG